MIMGETNEVIMTNEVDIIIGTITVMCAEDMKIVVLTIMAVVMIPEWDQGEGAVITMMLEVQVVLDLAQTFKINHQVYHHQGKL